MRKFFLALALVIVTASLHAITIMWNVPNSEYSWDNNIVSETSVGVYFVYSQNEISGHANVWDAAKNGATGVTVVSATTTGALVNGSADFDAKMGVSIDNPTEIFLSLGTDLELATNGYFYLVVFNVNSNTDEYAVSRAEQYTGNAKTDAEKGIYDTTVDGAEPTYGEFVDVSWMGGTWRDAVVPEPTALALLALGVAGLALRRKI